MTLRLTQSQSRLAGVQLPTKSINPSRKKEIAEEVTKWPRNPETHSLYNLNLPFLTAQSELMGKALPQGKLTVDIKKSSYG